MQNSQPATDAFAAIIDDIRKESAEYGEISYPWLQELVKTRLNETLTVRMVDLIRSFGIEISDCPDDVDDDTAYGHGRRIKTDSAVGTYMHNIKCFDLFSRDDEEKAFREMDEAGRIVRETFNRLPFAAEMYIDTLDRVASQQERFDHIVGREFRGKRDVYVSLIPTFKSKILALAPKDGEMDAESSAFSMFLAGLSFRQTAIEEMCENAYENIYLPYINIAKGENRGRNECDGDSGCVLERVGRISGTFVDAFSHIRKNLMISNRARDRIIKSNQRLVIFVAKKYKNRGIPFMDLIQEGNLGLVNAIRRFDYRKSHRFSTYAIWWIRQAICRAVETQTRTVRVPAHIVGQIERVKKTERDLLQGLSRFPTDMETAQAMNVSRKRVSELKGIALRPVSIDAKIGDDDGATYGDFLSDGRQDDAPDHTDEGILGEKMREMIEKLDDRERSVIEQRYGLTDGVQKTLDEIGARMNVTRECVRQIEASAIGKLRNIADVLHMSEFIRAC